MVFHPPFNPATIVTLMVSVVGIGWGAISYGFRHQQYKQGYWK